MWKNVSKEVLDKGQYIVPLKKVELQLKYAETLVKIDKITTIIKGIAYGKDKDYYVDKIIEIYEILEDEEV